MLTKYRERTVLVNRLVALRCTKCSINELSLGKRRRDLVNESSKAREVNVRERTLKMHVVPAIKAVHPNA